MSNRRYFLRNALAGATGLAAIPAILAATETPTPSVPKIGKNFLNTGDTILFQGDSITDAGRNKEVNGPNMLNSLGGGYAFLAAADILNSLAAKNLKVYNRGISGNKVFQLAERWQKDCLDLKPSLLSIMIGVNDFWHMHDGKYDGTPEVYEKDFRALLRRTKDALPDVKIVILEPYAVPGTKSVDGTWFPEFHKYRAVARKIAGEFKAVFVPTHDIFAKAVQIAPPPYWTPDGVHPSLAGSKLIADAWMKYVFGK